MLEQIIQVASNPSPLEWLATHIQLVGWPFICFVAWQASKVFTNIMHAITKTFGQIDTMASNHFPHMEASLLKQDGILANQTTLLTSVDTSLKLMVGAQFKPLDNHTTEMLVLRSEEKPV